MIVNGTGLIYVYVYKAPLKYNRSKVLYNILRIFDGFCYVVLKQRTDTPIQYSTQNTTKNPLSVCVRERILTCCHIRNAWLVFRVTENLELALRI